MTDTNVELKKASPRCFCVSHTCQYMCIACNVCALRFYSVLLLNSMEWHGIRGQYVVYPVDLPVPSIRHEQIVGRGDIARERHLIFRDVRTLCHGADHHHCLRKAKAERQDAVPIERESGCPLVTCCVLDCQLAELGVAETILACELVVWVARPPKVRPWAHTQVQRLQIGKVLRKSGRIESFEEDGQRAQHCVAIQMIETDLDCRRQGERETLETRRCCQDLERRVCDTHLLAGAVRRCDVLIDLLDLLPEPLEQRLQADRGHVLTPTDV